MSEENIGKHLFTIDYGCNYRGVIVKETEKSFTVRHPRWRETRMIKTSSMTMLDASADPTATERKGDAVWRSFTEMITEAHEAVARLKRERVDAVRASLQQGDTAS
jgi:hypothetical protein